MARPGATELGTKRSIFGVNKTDAFTLIPYLSGLGQGMMGSKEFLTIKIDDFVKSRIHPVLVPYHLVFCHKKQENLCVRPFGLRASPALGFRC